MSNAHDKAKLAQLIEIEGYESTEELLEAVFADAGSPAMCMNEACYFTCEMEPDQHTGYCEEFGTNQMKAAPVLAGIFQGPQQPIPTPIEPIVGLTYRAASTVGTAA